MSETPNLQEHYTLISAECLAMARVIRASFERCIYQDQRVVMFEQHRRSMLRAAVFARLADRAAVSFDIGDGSGIGALLVARDQARGGE